MNTVAFKTEAINTIGKVVKSRSACVKKGAGRKVSEKTIMPVREQYKLYNKKWSTKGVALFLIRYSENLFEMTTAAVQVQKLVVLIEQAKYLITTENGQIQH